MGAGGWFEESVRCNGRSQLRDLPIHPHPLSHPSLYCGCSHTFGFCLDTGAYYLLPLPQINGREELTGRIEVVEEEEEL